MSNPAVPGPHASGIAVAGATEMRAAETAFSGKSDGSYRGSNFAMADTAVQATGPLKERDFLRKAPVALHRISAD